jgi:hypothetical protein
MEASGNKDKVCECNCMLLYFLVSGGGWVGGWVRLSPLGSSVTKWFIVPASDDR